MKCIKPHCTALLFASWVLASCTPETQNDRAQHPSVANVEVHNGSPEHLQVGDVFREPMSAGGYGPQMVIIPAGTFLMGSPEDELGHEEFESPQTLVTFERDLAVGRFEITRADWDLCVQAEVCHPGFITYLGRSDLPVARPITPEDRTQLSDHPVAHISWFRAQEYVDWLSEQTRQPYRLLSEAEWEYAARAGTAGMFSNDGGYERLCEISNHVDLSFSQSSLANTSCSDGFGKTTAPVGSFAPNAFGLYDMHGNVAEWVQDCWLDSLDTMQPDGAARTRLTDECIHDQNQFRDLRLLRGGGWQGTFSANRSANRTYTFDAEFGSHTTGMRVARELPRRSR